MVGLEEGTGNQLLFEHAGFDSDSSIQQLSRHMMNDGWRIHVFNQFMKVLYGFSPKE